VVDFQHPWLQLVIQHYVKAQKVKAGIWLFGMASLVQVTQLRLHCKDCFHDYLLDLAPDLLR
jgi:hypothetical protein